MSMKEYKARNGKIYLRFNNGPERCPICGRATGVSCQKIKP